MKKNIMGSRLRSLRESIKYSQAKLALENGKVAQSAVHRYENGQITPSTDVLIWYADYFDVSLDYIFGRTDNPRGKLYDCKPPIDTDNEELKEFVEMLFDPSAPVNARLKEALLNILKEQKK